MDTNFIPEDVDKNLPFISVIIPARNEELFIERTLTQLEAQTYPKALMEVLIVDGKSTDRTIDIVHHWQKKARLNVKVFSNLKRVSSCARNIGIGAAKGHYILFIDAHVFIPSNSLVEDMASSALRHEAKVLGRSQPLTPPSLSDFQQIVAGVRNSSFGHSVTSYIYSDYEGWVSPVSIAVMYHRSVFQEVGFFDERFDAAEDVEFNYRLACNGYQAYISPLFKILYYPRKNLPSLIKQMFRYGVGRAKFTRKHQNGFHAELFAPIVVLIGFITMLFLAFDRQEFPIVIAISIVCYLAIFLTLFKSFPKKFHLLIAPALLLVIHIGLALGLLIGFVNILMKKNFNNYE